MKSTFFILLIALTGLTFTSGCRKKKDTTAVITVRDSSNGNAIVSGASVRVYGTASYDDAPTPVVDNTSTTDNEGKATFNYNDIYQQGQAGVAVLDIDCSSGAKTGTGIIKIEAEKVNTATVYIQ